MKNDQLVGILWLIKLRKKVSILALENFRSLLKLFKNNIKFETVFYENP